MNDQVNRLCKMLSLTGALSFEEVCKAAADRIAKLEAEKSKQLPAHWQAELDESKTLRAHMDELEKAIERFMENNDE
jgi:predicted nuclease with TOPRIM domain